MDAWPEILAHYVGICVETVAVAIIAIGSIEALFGIVRLLLRGNATHTEKRALWLQYTQWLVAALTFQLAADIVHTSIAPSWDDIGRLGAIAVIRTFLTYFLDHDVEKTRRLDGAGESG